MSRKFSKPDSNSPLIIDDAISCVLFYIQDNLDSDLTLEALAKLAGYSPFYFQRAFLRAVGETPKQYIQRMRLERSAYLLGIHDSTVLDIALNSGFKNHETLCRAFKKHFKIAPTTYRDLSAKNRSTAHRPKTALRSDRHISEPKIRIEKLNPIPVAFLRLVGSYWDIPDPTTPGDQAWNTLIEWAIQSQIYDHNLLLGITHDDPQTTPEDRLRCDACIQVPNDFPVPRRFRYKLVEGGYYASISHFGAFDSIDRSYAELARQARGLKGYRLRYAPTFQIYRSTDINQDYALYQTDIYLPLEQC